MSKYIPSERVDTRFLPLTPEKLKALIGYYYSGYTASRAAKLVPCSAATAWRHYHSLGCGITPKPYDQSVDNPKRRRKPSGPKPGWGSLKRWGEGSKHAKPLNNEARFYHSTFEPS